MINEEKKILKKSNKSIGFYIGILILIIGIIMIMSVNKKKPQEKGKQ